MSSLDNNTDIDEIGKSRKKVTSKKRKTPSKKSRSTKKTKKSTRAKKSTRTKKTATKKSKRTKKTATKKSKQAKKSKKVKKTEEISCDIEEEKCNSNKYSKQQIVELAVKCGIDPEKKTKKVLCQEIVNKYLASKKEEEEAEEVEAEEEAEEAEEEAEEELTEAYLNSLKKPELVELAMKLELPKKYKTMKKEIIIQAILEKQIKTIEEPVTIIEQPPVAVFVEEPLTVIEKPLAVIEEPIEEECYGGSMVNLLQKKVEELSELLSKAGISEGQPDLPEEKFEYLFSIKQKSTCDPLNNINCK